MKTQIESIIKASLEELNEERDEKLEINHNLKLTGPDGVLDSIDLVNLTVAIEEKLSDDLDLEIVLASEKAFSRKKSPFMNIESLTEFILELAEVA